MVPTAIVDEVKSK